MLRLFGSILDDSEEYDLLLSSGEGAGDGVLFVFKYEEREAFFDEGFGERAFNSAKDYCSRKKTIRRVQVQYRCQNRDVRALVEQALKGLHGYSGQKSPLAVLFAS